VAGAIGYHRDGAGAIGQIEWETRHDCSTEFL
jgi:hypothetical protein